jgi:hypothetical protein
VSGVWDDSKMTVEIPTVTQYTHSVKLEETAQGLRIHVYVYANDRETAMNQAIQTYDLTKRGLENLKIVLAPMEIKKK